MIYSQTHQTDLWALAVIFSLSTLWKFGTTNVSWIKHKVTQFYRYIEIVNDIYRYIKKKSWVTNSNSEWIKDMSSNYIPWLQSRILFLSAFGFLMNQFLLCGSIFVCAVQHRRPLLHIRWRTEASGQKRMVGYVPTSKKGLRFYIDPAWSPSKRPKLLKTTRAEVERTKEP